MKSRLKELKDNHEFRKGEGWEITTLSEDIDWLIEQAEKVERLERVNLVSTHLMTDNQLEKLKQLINK